MKATAPPAKRRRGPRLAVLALVFCSLLVPIAFLFNRFPAGESSALSPPPRPSARGGPGFGECGRRRGSDRRLAPRIYFAERCSVCCRLAWPIGDFVVVLFCYVGIIWRFGSDWFDRLLLRSVCDG